MDYFTPTQTLTTRQKARSFHRKISLLAALLGILIAVNCGLLKKEQQLPSEAADASASPSAPVSVTMNRETYGTTADLTDFRETIGSVMRERASNGLFMEDTNQVANTVHVNPDPSVSIGNFADLLLAINESGGKGYLAVNTEQSGRSTEPRPPNPYTLIVTVGEPQPEPPFLHVVRADEVDRSSIAPSIKIITDASDIKHARAIGSNFEISAAGEYFLNGPAIYFSGTDIDEVEVFQRAIDRADIGRGVATVTSAKKGVVIIASESATLQSLLDVFASVDATTFEWDLVVLRKKTKESTR